MSAVAQTSDTEMPTPILFTDSAAAKVAELIAEDHSLLADLLRHFPTRIEGLAEEVAERPVRESAPEWPSREASAEMHFAALLARQRWWVSQHAIGRRA